MRRALLLGVALGLGLVPATPVHAGSRSPARQLRKAGANPLRRQPPKWNSEGTHFEVMDAAAKRGEEFLGELARDPKKGVFDVFHVGLGTEARHQVAKAKTALGRTPHVMIFEEKLEKTLAGEGGRRDTRFFGWDLGWSAFPLRGGAQLVGNRGIESISEPGNGPARYKIALSSGHEVWANRVSMEPDLVHPNMWTRDLPSVQRTSAFLKANGEAKLARSKFGFAGEPLVLGEQKFAGHGYYGPDHWVRKMILGGRAVTVANEQGVIGRWQKLRVPSSSHSTREEATAAAPGVSVKLGTTDYLGLPEGYRVAGPENRPGASYTSYGYYKDVIRATTGLVPRDKAPGDRFEVVLESYRAGKPGFIKVAVEVTEGLGKANQALAAATD